MDVKLVVMTHKKKQRKHGTGGQTMRLIDADEFCRYTDEHCQDGFADLWKELIRR